MQRRKFLVGTAGTAIGSSALIGSGAFTTGVLEDRRSNIDVVHDAVGAISLIDTMPNSDVVGYSDNPGKLEIDFTAGGAQGANVGGMFKLGYHPGDEELEQDSASNRGLGAAHPDLNEEEMGDYWWNSAFAIWNRGTQTYDLTVEYDPDEDAGGSELKIYLFNGGKWTYQEPAEGVKSPSNPPAAALTIDGSDSDSYTITGDEATPYSGDDRPFAPGKRVFVSMEVHTQDGTPEDDLSGAITITADNAR